VNDEVYDFVKIGEQIWMAENLRSTKNRFDNSLISNKIFTNFMSNTDFNGDETTNKQDSLYYVSRFGLIYQTNNFSVNSLKDLCPQGWKIPTTGDHETLGEFVRDSTGKSNNARFLIEYKTHYWDATESVEKNYFSLEEDEFNKFGFSLRGSGVSKGSFDYFRIKTELVGIKNSEEYITTHQISIEDGNTNLKIENKDKFCDYAVIRCIKKQ
jgi:uncharacterized protein (TIGR02145 family)